VFRIGGNTFYDQKNKILMKILELKRSGIGLIAEFSGIPNGFPNQGDCIVINHCVGGIVIVGRGDNDNHPGIVVTATMPRTMMMTKSWLGG
jgi:hypothetical protein